MSLRHKKLIVFAGVAAALLLAGCASPPERVLSQKSPAYAMLPNGYDPLKPNQFSPMYAAAVGEGANFIRQLEHKRGRALNILSLSGGGQNGAFGAGLLAGWRESGQRPQFDIVGGVSTGALLATHALLGTPPDDAQLEEMYTQITKKDIYKERGIFSLAFGADSLSDTAPLQELIAKYITAETLKRVAAAYDDNRYLAVGTTNIDYGQTLGLEYVADREGWKPRALSSGVARLCIVPHRLSAGGNRWSSVRRRGRPFESGHRRDGRGQRPPPPLYGPGNIYLVDNGRLHSPPEALRRALGDVAATTISVMMDQSMLTAMTRSYFGAKSLGYNFKMIAIPDDVNVGKDPLAFDPKQMRAAFEAGRAIAKKPDHWLTVPPEHRRYPQLGVGGDKVASPGREFLKSCLSG